MEQFTFSKDNVKVTSILKSFKGDIYKQVKFTTWKGIVKITLISYFINVIFAFFPIPLSYYRSNFMQLMHQDYD